MGKIVKGLLGLVVVVLLLAGGAYAWATMTVSSTLAQTYEAHSVEFAVPFPLTEAEVDAIRAEHPALPVVLLGGRRFGLNQGRGHARPFFLSFVPLGSCAGRRPFHHMFDELAHPAWELGSYG